MSTVVKSKYVDRDDFDADHYADCMRDTHRSRLTLDQLDIAQRQLRKKEKLLSRIHDLKMKEYARVKNGFIKKVEQDVRISNLPSVKEQLKGPRRQHLQPSPPPMANEQTQDVAAPTTESDEKPHQPKQHDKSMISHDSPRTERLKLNLDKFNHMNSLLS